MFPFLELFSLILPKVVFPKFEHSYLQFCKSFNLLALKIITFSFTVLGISIECSSFCYMFLEHQHLLSLFAYVSYVLVFQIFHFIFSIAIFNLLFNQFTTLIAFFLLILELLLLGSLKLSSLF